MTYIEMGQVLEGAMLICFGISWPASILKTWRAKTVAGKSLLFLSLIFSGYLAGIGAKLFRALDGGTWPELVTVLYVINACLVGTDILLYLKYSRAARAAGNRKDTQ
jgi:hypothetical protein